MLPKNMIGDYILKEYEELDSTQLEAKRLLSNSPSAQTTIISTKRQLSGRGRYERVWHSDEGDAIFTIIVSPRCAIETWSQVAYIGAIAVGETILSYINDLDVTYKWVNDVLIQGRKIAGVLLEVYNSSTLLIGIGVNIVKKEQISGVAKKPISIEDLDIVVDRKALINSILDRFFSVLRAWECYGFTPVREMWIKRAQSINSDINVRFLDKEIRGKFIDIDKDGKLLLNVENSVRIITAGEVWN
ncbi:biotin--[acetyl-CoA-carboxylase] ligase [Candidatus Lariskella endosymbiont of Hedychridium roseum]|uniref:biotin--[acetyl-CoA-carboxylase] ligase n=1 Tax=Candidatus Lariskella endosymbiont of Hedychridium roseum TaxID=3077949 RepID=UPI0030D139DB